MYIYFEDICYIVIKRLFIFIINYFYILLKTFLFKNIYFDYFVLLISIIRA